MRACVGFRFLPDLAQAVCDAMPEDDDAAEELAPADPNGNYPWVNKYARQ